MDRIRVGIIGTGYTVGIAGMHVTGYLSRKDECELVALYDTVPGRAARWALEKKLENVTICQSADELLGMVDAVSLCVPNSEHIPLLMKAFAADRHVLCEKPISVDAATAEAALRAEPRGKVHMIGFSYRGIPALRYMKRLLDEGRIGRVYTYRETLGGNRIANPDVKLEWRMRRDTSGSGALADFGCHMIDLCDWLLHETQGPIVQACGMVARSIPTRADIETGEMKPVTNDDSASFTLRLENARAGFLCGQQARRGPPYAGDLRRGRHAPVPGRQAQRGGTVAKAHRRRLRPEGPGGKPAGSAGTGDRTVAERRICGVPACIREGRKPERSLERGAYIQSIVDQTDEACRNGGWIDVKA
jgi:predicted dehydrogenase